VLASRWPKSFRRMRPGSRSTGSVLWRERAKSTGTSFLPPAKKTIGKRSADEAATRYSHLGVERARSRASFRSPGCHTGESQERVVAFSHLVVGGSDSLSEKQIDIASESPGVGG